MGVKAFFGQFKNFKKKYLSKNPKEKWTFLRNITASILNVLGCDFMQKNFKLTFKSFVPATCLFLNIVLLIYNAYYYRNERMFMKVLQILSVFALFTPVRFFPSNNNILIFKWTNMILLLGNSRVFFGVDSVSVSKVSSIV